MAKIKKVLPTLREKKRYLAFEIISKNSINSTASVYKEIWSSILSFCGTKGAGKAGIWILNDKYNAQKQKGIIRVSHRHLDELKSALMLIKEIDSQDVIVHSLGASGILNKAEKYTLQDKK